MRKNLIAMSVATLVAGLGMAGGAAAAVLLDNGGATISPSNATFQTVQAGGIGHQLIIPYFNTQLGNATLFQLVNTDGVNGKAVKVRFRGASNSDDLFDFQVYLSPNDVWTANVSQDAATGLSILTTNDKSCTIPAVNAQTFVTARLPQAANGWSDAERAEQTREGYIEIFNMADVPPLSISPATGAPVAPANPLFTAIKHVNGVPPCSGVAIANLANEPLGVHRGDRAALVVRRQDGQAGGGILADVRGPHVVGRQVDLEVEQVVGVRRAGKRTLTALPFTPSVLTS